ncbi:MAG: hypothetical protein ACR2GY_04440 [Phycisphaerales bacterium]
MKNTLLSIITILLGATLLLTPGCKKTPNNTGNNTGGTHTHDDGTVHSDDEPDDLVHEEVSLGSIIIDDMTVELAQAHGAIAAGKELHLIVKLPYSDAGETVVRAWLGTDDRTSSLVGKGEYASDEDEYNIHAVAPDPLPADTMWWIEIEKPDGSKSIGSAQPIQE